MPQISPHAVVARPENLAEDVVVGAFAYIGPEVHVGPGSRVDNNAALDGSTRIGRNTHIYPFAAIGHAGQDPAARGQVVIGDRNMIREHAVIHPGSRADSATLIGSDTLISIGCCIGPDVTVADNVMLGTYSQLGQGTRVQQHVWASAFTGTERDVTIGQYSFTSGYAGIDHDAPPYAVCMGFPFRVRGVNVQNLKRCGFDEETIAGLKGIVRALFNGECRQVAPEALADWVARDDLNAHQRYLVEFLADHTPGGPAGEQGD